MLRTATRAASETFWFVMCMVVIGAITMTPAALVLLVEHLTTR